MMINAQSLDKQRNHLCLVKRIVSEMTLTLMAILLVARATSRPIVSWEGGPHCDTMFVVGDGAKINCHGHTIYGTYSDTVAFSLEGNAEIKKLFSLRTIQRVLKHWLE